MKNETHGVYKMTFDYGRQGELQGLFIAKKKHVELLISSKMEIDFGEVLGKHSEVIGYVSESEIKLVSDSQEVIDLIREHGLSSGYNPFDYPVRNNDGEYPDDTTVGEALDILIAQSNP